MDAGRERELEFDGESVIAHEHRLIVVHIPRCGGTSLETAFGDMTGHHARASWYKAHFPQEWESYWRVALVRPPLERFLSLWRYWTHLDEMTWGWREDEAKRLRCWWRYRARCGMTPEGLARALPDLAGESWTDGHFQPQRSWLDEDVEVMPMLHGLATIGRMTGVEIPWLNASPACDPVSSGPWVDEVLRFYAEDRGLCG